MGTTGSTCLLASANLSINNAQPKQHQAIDLSRTRYNHLILFLNISFGLKSEIPNAQNAQIPIPARCMCVRKQNKVPLTHSCLMLDRVHAFTNCFLLWVKPNACCLAVTRARYLCRVGWRMLRPMLMSGPIERSMFVTIQRLCAWSHPTKLTSNPILRIRSGARG